MSFGLLLVDDHVAIAQALVAAFREAGFDPVESVDVDGLDDATVRDAVERVRPAVGLVDLNLGDAGSGLDVVPVFKELDVPVVVFSASNATGDLAASVRAGAVGFLNKSAPFDVITDYVGRVASGQEVMTEPQRAELVALAEENDAEALERMARFGSLTDRERQVLLMLADGRTPKEVARAHGTAVNTVRNQMKAIRRKLDVDTQFAAVAFANEVTALRDR